MSFTGMKSAEEIARNLPAALIDRLGSRYQVLSHLEPADNDSLLSKTATEPDILLYDSTSKNFVLVEVKGSPGTDLPLAVVPLIKKAKQLYRDLDPTFVLVSAAYVTPTVRRQLAWENVNLLEFHNEEQLISGLLEVLANNEDSWKHTLHYPEVWSDKGWVLFRLRRYEEAAEAFDRALSLRPDYPEVWSAKGSALTELGKYEEGFNEQGVSRYQEAAEAFDRALSLRPDYPEVWNSKGWTLVELGSYKEAIEAYEQALVLRPDYFEVWNDMGWALVKLARYEEESGRSEEARGRYEEAVRAFEHALKLRSDYPDVWYNMGLALGKLGQREAAIRWLCSAWHAQERLSDREGQVAKALKELGYEAERCKEGFLSTP